MKSKITTGFLIPTACLLMVFSLSLLTGCGNGSDTTGNSSTSAGSTFGNTSGNITQAEAETIALDSAGFTADSVTGINTRYEVDDGVPQYEVDFYRDNTEYDFTIHAGTGEILEHDIDNPKD